MTREARSYRWTKLKNGIGYVAVVNIDVIPNLDGRNEIKEHYGGKGFTSQGQLEEVPEEGYDLWKAGARAGLEYGFSLDHNYWTVHIKSIAGLSTDTNPTIVGYTMLRAFLDRINLELDSNRIEELEEFVLLSWLKPNETLIPDFFRLRFVSTDNRR
ncbi:hypothetical protein [Longitalea arenae]|uniref:hypothetical protein n=1 Tax=Longitalea arenae TaxID=2812558 RepID=UPI001967F1BB|nr:hypothetical protein [Longitalea arenae]